MPEQIDSTGGRTELAGKTEEQTEKQTDGLADRPTDGRTDG